MAPTPQVGLTQKRQMPEEPPEGSPSNNPTPSEPAKLSLTQDELTQKLTREKDEGRRSARQQLLKELGIEDTENFDAKQISAQLAAAKEREDADKTELQRANERAEIAERDKAELTTKAEQRAHDEAVKRQLILAGLPLPEDEEAAENTLDMIVKLIPVQPGATAEDIRKSVKATKEVHFPQLFVKGTSEPTPTATPGSVPSAAPTRKPANAESAKARAARMSASANAKRGVEAPTPTA